MKEVTLDIETDGLPPKGADYKVDFMSFPHIVTMAWKINDGETKHYIINQENRIIPDDVIAIHGVTNAMCSASDRIIDGVFEEFLEDCVNNDISIGHNIYFDSSIIKANFRRLFQQERIQGHWLDTLEDILNKDRRVDTMHASIRYCNLPGRYGPKWPKLTELHQKLFNEGFEAHNSKDDVNATRRCYLRLKELKIIP